MEKRPSIKKNFIMNALLSMSSVIFPLITFPYVSRILLPEGTGKVSFATSLISYFSLFAQLGIPTYGIRVCAQVRDDREELTRTAQELLLINLIMDAVSYAAMAVALVFVPRLREDRPLYLIVSTTILLTSIGMDWLYQAMEQYTYITVRSVIFKFVALIAMFLLVHRKEDYVIYGAISIFASSASNILNFVNAHRYIDMRPVGHYHLKRHLKPIGIFFAMSCATTIYTNLDTVMLGFITTSTDVGYYNAAVKIKGVLVSVVTSLGAVILPRASYYIEKGQTEEFRRITARALEFAFLCATPLALYFMLFAKQSIYFLSGPAYTGSIAPMILIMPTLLFIGITGITGYEILIPTRNEKIVLYSEVAGAIIDLLLNAILIPGMKSSGAAIGTLVAEFVVFLVQYGYLRGELGRILRGIPHGKILIAILLAAVCSFWVPNLGLGSFLTLLISALLFFGVYGGCLLALRESMILEIWEQFRSKGKRRG